MIHFELVSPEAKFFAEDVKMAVIPGTEGDFGVLGGHMPLVANVRAGLVEIYREDMKQVSERVFIAGGVADVTGTQCTLLAEQAVNVNDLDKAAIEAQIADINDHLSFVEEKHEIDRFHKRLAVLNAMLHYAA